ncbi:hypothetical protein J6590_039188 [Homalodisca vitripennis]|nr:hypothetical protein J6590_039188 [Homalodisca vitripennis]
MLLRSSEPPIEKKQYDQNCSTRAEPKRIVSPPSTYRSRLVLWCTVRISAGKEIDPRRTMESLPYKWEKHKSRTETDRQSAEYIRVV